jgi:hypothetical protein
MENKSKINILDITVAKKMVTLKTSADDRGIEFNVSFRKLKQVMHNRKCFYTGVDLTFTQGDNLHTIDRIDASKGYIDNNIVQCSQNFNRMKSNLTLDDLRLIIMRLKTKGIKI